MDQQTDYIPISLIFEIVHDSDFILVRLKGEDALEYKTTNFTVDANGIHGYFVKY